MNKLKATLLLCVLAKVAGLTLHAAEIPPWPHEGSDLPVDSRVEWGQLDNGLRYVLLPWNEPPERVSLRMVVEAGSLHESESQRGLAHFIEHMAFNGTENFSAGEMVEYFQRLGMAFGPDTNAHTWWRETVYKLELPNNNEDILNDGFKLFRDYADRMLMDSEEIDKERGVVLSEMRDRDSPAFQAYLDKLNFLLPQSRIPERVTIGKEFVLRLAPQKEFLDFYNKWYTLDRMVLVAVGDIEPEQLKSLMKNHFGNMEAPDKREPTPDLGELKQSPLQTRLYSDEELPRTQVEITTRHKISREPLTKERLTLEYARDLGSLILNRRFEKISKEDGSPLVSGSSYNYPWLDFVYYAGLSADVGEPEQWEDGLKIAAQELKRAVQYGFTEAELAEAKANILQGLREAARQSETRKSREISSTLVRSLIDNQVFMDPEAKLAIFEPIIEDFSLEDVNEAFRGMWDQDDRSVFVSGKLNRLATQSFEKAMDTELEAPEQRETQEFAYKSFGESGEVVEKEHIEDLDILQAELSNNIRVNVKKTDFEANQIKVAVRFGGGLLEMPIDKPGIALLAENILIEGGLGEHSRDDLNEILAGKTVSSSLTVDSDAFLLRGQSNPDDLALQLQLLTAYITDPGYRPEAERMIRKKFDALYTQLKHNPQGVLENEVASFLAEDDPRFGFPEREKLESITTADVKKWLKEPLENSYMEVSIVGDVEDPEKVLKLVEETLGNLDNRAEALDDFEESRQVSFPRGADPKTFHYITEQDRAYASAHWPTVDNEDIELNRQLGILGRVFSDRMRVQIREEIGEAYSPVAYNNSSDAFEDYGWFRAIVGVEPSQAGMISNLLVEIGNEIATEGISEDELVRAVEPIKTQVKVNRRDNDYWLNTVLLKSQVDPKRLDWARNYLDYWDSVTVPMIEDLAKRFLEQEDPVTILVLPQKS